MNNQKLITKENDLAFLNYLFENTKDPTNNRIIQKLIARFAKQSEGTEIDFELVNWISNWNNKSGVDIICHFSVLHEIHSVYIKIKSNEECDSRILKEITDFINETHNSDHIYKIYYKNTIATYEEKNIIESLGWGMFDLESIYDFFKNIESEQPKVNSYLKNVKFNYFNIR